MDGGANQRDATPGTLASTGEPAGPFGVLNIRRSTVGGPVLPLVYSGYLGLMSGLSATAFRLLIPEIRHDLGIGIGVMTLLATAPGLIFTALTPLIGFISDRARRVTLQAVAAVVSNLSIMFGGIAPSAALFISSKVLESGGAMIGAPVGYSLLSDYYPPRARGRVFSFLGLTTATGAIIAPLLVGVMASNLGWRHTLVVLGSVATIVSLGLFRLREPVRGMHERIALGVDPETAAREQHPLGWWQSWRVAWNIRTVRRFAYAQPFIMGGLNTSGVLLILYYVQRFHLSPFQRGLVVTLAYCPALIGCVITGWLTDRMTLWRPGRMVTLAAAVVGLVAVGNVMIVAAPVLALAVVFHGIISLSAALIQPAMATTMSLVLPARIRGLGQQTVAPFLLLGFLTSLVLSAFGQRAGIVAGVVACTPIILIGAWIFATASHSVGADIQAALEASLHEAQTAGFAGRTNG